MNRAKAVVSILYTLAIVCMITGLVLAALGYPLLQAIVLGYIFFVPAFFFDWYFFRR